MLEVFDIFITMQKMLVKHVFRAEMLFASTTFAKNAEDEIIEFESIDLDLNRIF